MIQVQFGMPLFLMGFYGSIMVLVVLAVRFLLGRWLPKRIIPVLWALVLVRLLVPFSVSSPLSLPVPSFLEDMGYYSYAEMDTAVLSGVNFFGFGNQNQVTIAQSSAVPIDSVDFGIIPSEDVDSDIPSVASVQEGTEYTTAFLVGNGAATTDWSWKGLLPNVRGMNFGGVWLAGMIVLALVLCWRYFRSRSSFRGIYELDENQVIRRTLVACRVDAKVYSCDTIKSPVAAGVLLPFILLPASLDFRQEELVRHILTHEAMHIRRKDNLVKLVLMAALCLHWYNPLVWVMAREFCRDMESACDEAALAVLGAEESAPYAQSLLEMAVPGLGGGLFASAFSRTEVERRVKGVLAYKKPGVFTLTAAAVLVLYSTVAFATCGQGFFDDYLGDWCYSGNTYVARAALNRPIDLGGSRDYARSRTNKVVNEVLRDSVADDVPVANLEKDIQKRLALEFGVEPGAFKVLVAPAIDPEAIAKQYEEHGLKKDKETGRWTLDGKKVHVLEDQLAGEYYSDWQGEVDVYVIRDEQYKLLRVEVFDYYRF